MALIYFGLGSLLLNAHFLVWKGNKNTIFLAAIVGGLADLGYFMFLDLGGFVKFVPGTIMTFVSASAIILSFYAHLKNSRT
jgi:hypothetical protein